MKKFSNRFYQGFDLLYHAVTAEIAATTASNWRFSECDAWIEVLVSRFWIERGTWPISPLDKSPALTRDYFSAASHLRLGILRITACAFLHISYDLPRVIASEWPGSGNWEHGPTETEAEGAYTALESIFPVVATAAIKQRDIVGLPSLILGRIPYVLIRIASCWIFRLRLAAWSHARVLQSAPNRPAIEIRMLRAMTAAINDVKNLAPWSVGLLGPPNEAIFDISGLAAVAVGVGEIKLASLVVLVGAACLFLLHVAHVRRDLVEAMIFIDEFGRRVHEYVEVAVTNSEEFETYLKRRASGLPGNSK